jgi:hypothetical protein
MSVVKNGFWELQDLVKRVRTPQAMCALLRVRTCRELCVSKVYGKVQQDVDHENLWHVVAIGPHDSLTFCLELASSRGFVPRASERLPQPCIQVSQLVILLLTGSVICSACLTASGLLLFIVPFLDDCCAWRANHPCEQVWHLLFNV